MLIIPYEVPRGPTVPMVQVVGQAHAWCRVFRVNQEKHLITCAECGKEFTGYDAFVAVSRRWGDYQNNIHSLKAEREELRKEVEAIKVEVKNLKAMKKRATDSAGLSGRANPTWPEMMQGGGARARRKKPA